MTSEELEKLAQRYTEAWCRQDPGVRMSGYEVWKVDTDGLIAESEGHFDATEYERQLREGAGPIGLFPAMSCKRISEMRTRTPERLRDSRRTC
jgi:hypothetical protein